MINYEIIGSSDTIEEFDKKTDKFCYYCKTTDTSLFKTEPHLTPELLTQNRNTYNYECDACNGFFSKEYENHLTDFTRPFVLMTGCKTKKGYPKIKLSNGDFIQFQNGELRINNIHDSFPITYDEENKTATIEIPRKKFIPYKVYKSLVKIGISLLPPDKIENYSETIKWLINSELDVLNNPLYLANAFAFKMAGRRYDKPFASLYEAKELIIGDMEYLQHTLILGFANFAIQIFLPPSKEFDKIHNSKNQLGLELFPIITNHVKAFPNMGVEIFRYDLGEKNQVTASEVFTVNYQKREQQS